jgi:hypothetical protein
VVPLAIDHVLIPVDDLAAAGATMKARYGLTSIEGGRHPGWGTANRVVPLGDAYLELVAVIDRDAAALRTSCRRDPRSGVDATDQARQFPRSARDD